MKCQKCQTDNKIGAKFCARCGSKLEAVDPRKTLSPQYSAPSSGSKTMISSAPVMPGGKYINELVVGRDSANDIMLNEPSVSGKHAKIYLEEGSVFIEDLRSLNGTFVNGKRVEGRVKIKSGDNISLGSFSLNNNRQVADLMSRSDDGALIKDGTIRLAFNPKWVGKILYFVLFVLFLLPWITISGGGGQFSLTALDIATNRLPAGITAKGLNFPGYGAAHTIFLILFILTIIGIVLSFIKMPITEKLNTVNLLSLVIFILAVVIVIGANTTISFDDVIIKLIAEAIDLNIAFPGVLFVLVSFISIFEGLIEHHISNK